MGDLERVWGARGSSSFPSRSPFISKVDLSSFLECPWTQPLWHLWSFSLCLDRPGPLMTLLTPALPVMTFLKISLGTLCILMAPPLLQRWPSLCAPPSYWVKSKLLSLLSLPWTALWAIHTIPPSPSLALQTLTHHQGPPLPSLGASVLASLHKSGAKENQ